MGRKTNYHAPGFTLLEVLIAIALVAVIVGIMISTLSSSRGNIEEAISNVERAIRFATGEAALRNVITRVQFDLDKDPQELSVEYGPDNSFVLPPRDVNIMGKNKDDETSKEAIEDEKRIKKLNQAFNKVSEFNDGPLQLPGGVNIVAIGTNVSLKLITNYFASIYIYPSGEKDGAIIIFAAANEIVGVTISPFSEEFNRTYKEVKVLNEIDDIDTVRLNMAKEMYEEWLKE